MHDQRPPEPGSPVIGIVIPAFKHSVYLGEAIQSALTQDISEPYIVTIVNDGCPFVETELCASAAAAAADNVFALIKPNGGLSSARNFGVEFCLSNFPNLEAIYMLDADNRLSRSSLRIALDLLRKNEAGWAYPNIDKFGIEWCGNYSAAYSRLSHVAGDNICEAGSLISTRLFHAGIRFDENMKEGFEDWDFWLQAISAGFVGVTDPAFCLEYRQRSESMLRDANRSRQSIISYMRKKHKDLYNTSTMLEWEHSESPRFCLIDWDLRKVALFTDPSIPGRVIELSDFKDMFLAEEMHPQIFGTPPIYVFGPLGSLSDLSRTKLLHSAFNLIDRLTEQHHFVLLRTVPTEGVLGLQPKLLEIDSSLPDGIALWAVRQDLFRACIADEAEDWFRSLFTERPTPTVGLLELAYPARQFTMSFPRSATSSLVGTFEDLRATRNPGPASAPKAWFWRDASYSLEIRSYRSALESSAGSKHVMPRLRCSHRPQIGFVIPVAEFGGVEKVAYAVAQAVKAAGADVHLFVAGAERAQNISDITDVFSSINFFSDRNFDIIGGSSKFFGHTVAMTSDFSETSYRLLGWLSGLDALVVSHAAALNSVLGDLKRAGTRIFTHLHVLDRTPFGREVGHPYVSLAYEHVYEGVLTCSLELAHWLHSLGVPSEKILHIPNAPSFDLDPATREELLKVRESRQADGEIEALFLGRLDYQKGIERLVMAIEKAREARVPVRWRVMGEKVLGRGLSEQLLARIDAAGVEIERPVFEPEALGRVLASAHVLVLPSRWEGAPLTILEAQSLGCVPIATDVGAVSELITHGQSGYLVPDGDDSNVSDAIVALIDALAQERPLLSTTSAFCIAATSSVNWSENAAPFVRALLGER